MTRRTIRLGRRHDDPVVVVQPHPIVEALGVALVFTAAVALVVLLLLVL